MSEEEEDEEPATLVVDLGAHTTRLMYAGDGDVSAALPTVVSTPRHARADLMASLLLKGAAKEGRLSAMGRTCSGRLHVRTRDCLRAPAVEHAFGADRFFNADTNDVARRFLPGERTTVWPIERGEVVDWEAMEGFWEHKVLGGVRNSSLRTVGAEVFVGSQHSAKDMARLAELTFEQWDGCCSAMGFGYPAELSLCQ